MSSTSVSFIVFGGARGRFIRTLAAWEANMDVVGFDCPTVDFLVHVDRIPGTNKSTDLLEYGWQGGGKVSTALVTLGRLGIDTGIIGVVGDDKYGKFCIQDFKAHRVDTSRLVIDKGATSTFCVCISERETLGRNIIGRRGTVRELDLNDIDREYITSAKYLHLSLMDPVTIQAAKWVREKGIKVVFDADYYHEEAEKNIELIDVFIGSEFFYNSMFANDHYEENYNAIRKRGPEIVIFTFGEKGCSGVDSKGFFTIPAYHVDVADTTGAGDVYHGAFIYGLLKGMNPRETARFASAVSAIKCTRVGGRAGIPDFLTVEKFMKEGIIDYSEIDERVRYYREFAFHT